MEKLKAEDMMRGDWIKTISYVDGEMCFGEVICVNGYNDIECVECKIKIEDVYETVIRSVDKCYPVLLTEKILVYNGWRKKNSDIWFYLSVGNDDVNICLGEGYTSVEYMNMCYNPKDNAEVNYGSNIEFPRKIYVHELQHLLRMFGVDKKIVLYGE